eukprot:TRINITY_DN13849_c0_g1_i1.p1 TRINITY_DN13849_c0_g1~~TRINITY_DN13849_c0_g1_i1.p1  ORF type:complete len:112 (+),score=5.67 TRINITY_DN13849_c0_g1_i1:177-512(+)
MTTPMAPRTRIAAVTPRPIAKPFTDPTPSILGAQPELSSEKTTVRDPWLYDVLFTSFSQSLPLVESLKFMPENSPPKVPYVTRVNDNESFLSFNHLTRSAALSATSSEATR